MNDEAKRDLKNVMVLTLVDGELSDGEKEFIERLRDRLGVDDADFRELVEEVRQDRKKLSLPSTPGTAREAVRVLAEAAMADGELDPTEQRLLQRIAEHTGISTSELDAMLSGPGQQPDDTEIDAGVDAIYTDFAAWDEPTRRAKVTELANMGRSAIVALLRLLESYRSPDGMDSGLPVKILVIEQLGCLRDERAAYYLAQHINLGDSHDEVSNAALRYTAAEALGKIVGENFSPDQSGVVAARAWWGGPDAKKYDRLAF